MPDFNPFDMDFDGHIDGIHFLGFDYLTRHVLQPDEGGQGGDAWNASCTEDEVHHESDDDEADDDYEESEMDWDDWQETDPLDAL